MTKRFGSLVGTPRQMAPVQPVDMAYENSKDKCAVRDTIVLAAAPATDTVQFGIFGWESVFNPGSAQYFAALGAGVTLSLGDVSFPNALINAVPAAAAGSVVFYRDVAIGNYWNPLWQVLGYASLKAAQAVAPRCELLFTIGGGAATGVITWQAFGSLRI